MRVLVVEDDAQVRAAVAAALRSAGLAVDEAADWRHADVNLSVNAYDCVVLDRILTDGDSAGPLYDRRRRGMTVPVLMLTALDDLPDRVDGFEAGADDYVSKPFFTTELIQRVRALCRRGGVTHPAVLRAGDIEMDVARREVRRAGVLQILTPKEFAVLEMLMIRDPSVVSRTDLIEHCWDEAADPASNVVDVIIAQLRRKLAEPVVIVTVRGAGYRLLAGP